MIFLDVTRLRFSAESVTSLIRHYLCLELKKISYELLILWSSGPSVPVPTANAGRQPAEQQPSGATDLPRASAENLVHQVFEGLLANASVPQESGPRVVPLRTVVAVPAGVAHPAPDSSGGAVGLLYPLYARFHQRTPGTLNDARVSQASLRTAQLQTPDSATRGNMGWPFTLL